MIQDTLGPYEANGAFLFNTDSGLVLTFGTVAIGYQQRIIWLNSDGTIRHDFNKTLRSISFAYACGGLVALVESPPVLPFGDRRHALIVHMYNSAGQRVSRDTLLSESLTENDIDGGAAFGAHEGSLTTALLTGHGSGNPDHYDIQIIRYRPSSITVGEPWNAGSVGQSGRLTTPGIALTPDDPIVRGVVGCASLAPGGREVRFWAFDSVGQPYGDSRTQAVDYDVSGLAILVDSGQVYAAYTSAQAGEFNGAYVCGYPLTALATVEKRSVKPPSGFAFAAYPNPFNSKTRIVFDLPSRARISLDVFDLNGRSVATLEPFVLSAGFHELSWSAGRLTSGVYLIRLQANDLSATKKVILVR
jgi:hypothetical protein